MVNVRLVWPAAKSRVPDGRLVVLARLGGSRRRWRSGRWRPGIVPPLRVTVIVAVPAFSAAL